jgi:hypothetical protein
MNLRSLRRERQRRMHTLIYTALLYSEWPWAVFAKWRKA